MKALQKGESLGIEFSEMIFEFSHYKFLGHKVSGMVERQLVHGPLDTLCEVTEFPVYDLIEGRDED